MRTLATFFLCAVTTLTAAPAAARNADSWDKTGSVARDVLVATALALPASKGEWNGELQAVMSIGGAYLITKVVKGTVEARRPDGSDRRSFPSGHTSRSFSAAATLHNRYGWKVGIPAHAVAAFVGVSRVQAGRHYWRDVLAGAAIGEASGLLLTTKLGPDVRLLPWGSRNSGGVSASLRF